VTDISEPRLIMLFTEGLTEPLRGWVKAYRPPILQDAILHTRYLEESVPKTKTFSKTFMPQKDQDMKPFQREWQGKEKLDDETRRDLIRKKLCFNCIEPWVLGHRRRTVDPLTQRRSQHKKRRNLPIDHRHQ
jgi:hypothetical protein